MAYQIDQWSSISTEIQRIGNEEIESGLAVLADDSLTAAHRIHDARKRCKKLRGLVRLIRPQLEKERYRCINRHFRDTARSVAQSRDATVLIETFNRVSERVSRQIDQRATDRIRASLVNQLHAHETALDMHSCLDQLGRDLESGKHWLLDLRIDKDGFNALGAGVVQVYRRARRGRKLAAGSPSTEAFHNWRKQVKYHYYHLKLLHSLSMEPMETAGNGVGLLGDLLGDAHDLAVLGAHLRKHPYAVESPASLSIVRSGLQLRQKELEHRALQRGKQLFAFPPEKLLKRLGVKCSTHMIVSR